MMNLLNLDITQTNQIKNVQYQKQKFLAYAFQYSQLVSKPYFNSNQPDIIALSETRLTEDSCHNILLPGYKFLGQHSKTIYSLVGEMGEIGFGPK